MPPVAHRRIDELPRRELLRLGAGGGLSLAGLTLGGFDLLGGSRSTAQAAAAGARPPGFGRAKSVIVVFCNGGQSQLDTWDPKPDAPDVVRGEFGTIATSVPGILLGEHLPRVAKLAHHYTILRSVSHQDVDHGSASYLTLTGHYHAKLSSNPPPLPTDEPTIGAVLKRARPQQRFPYDAVYVNAPALTVNEPLPGQYGGLLGREVEPLMLGDVTAAEASVPDLAPLADLPLERLQSRGQLRAALDEARRALDADRRSLDMNTLYRQAFELLASPQSRAAFDLTVESPQVRARYGDFRSGQACLLARRLVEAGVPLVSVMFNQHNRGQDRDPNDIELYGWDTHNDIFTALKDRLLPRFDLSFSALLEDLAVRGLLDTTLVVCLGEFGRAPIVALEKKFAGSSPGRKHWASAYSVVLAGAGVQGGAIFGRTDAMAGQVIADRVAPWDLHATIYHALGIDPGGEYHDNFGRPLRISQGRAITGLY